MQRPHALNWWERPRTWLTSGVAVALTGLAHAQTTPCTADLDNSGAVDAGDIGRLLVRFGDCSGAGGCEGDLDASGSVDAADIGMVLLSFGTCAGPGWATVLEWAPDPAVIYDANLRSDIAATHLPWRVRDNGTGIEMVLIPPGSFSMGCSASNLSGCREDELPLHQVTLRRPFYIGRFEVTQAQWVARTGDNPSHFTSPSSAVPASQVSARPVEQVSWHDVQQFCAQNGLRLPTEAEWEFAFRAGTSAAFHGWASSPNGTNADSQLGTIAWFDANSAEQTRPVGGKAANGFGLCDMSGNVGEWVHDWYGDYSAPPQIDPIGPDVGCCRVWRGDGWQGISEDGDCRASDRGFEPPDSYFDDLGFRVARTP